MPLVGAAGFRRARLALAGSEVRIDETVENLEPWDRPIAWTQHVTLGPPFLERGKTQFRADGHEVSKASRAISATASKPARISTGRRRRCKDGGTYDLRVYSDRDVSAGYTTHLMDPHREHASFDGFLAAAGAGASDTAGSAQDFPWLRHLGGEPGRADHAVERQDHDARAWSSARRRMPESRREMIERGIAVRRSGVSSGCPPHGTVSASYVGFLSLN